MYLLVIQKWAHLGPCLYLGPTVQQQPYHDDVAPAGGYVQGSDPILTEGTAGSLLEGATPSLSPAGLQGGMGQTKDRGELNPCPWTAQGNGLFHRAGREGEHLLLPAAKGLWTEATQILQESADSWIWLHPWDWKRHTNCRGYKLCLAARAPAFPQPGQKVPRASRDAWLHPTEGRHSRKGPR